MHDNFGPGRKLFIPGLIATLLAVPLFMVFLLVYDRESQSVTARNSIAQGWGGPQRLAGPVLALPYQHEEIETFRENGKESTRSKVVWDTLYLAPTTLKLDSTLAPESRSLSIYESVVYGADARGHAEFRLAPADLSRLSVSAESIAFDRAELRFGVSDPRALKLENRVTVNGTPLTPQPGNGPAATGGAGFFVPVDAAILNQGALTADFKLGFRGQTSLALVPMAGQTEWNVKSSWPHPSFAGSFLPESPDVTASGFAATYRIGNLALGSTLLTVDDPAPSREGDAGRAYADRPAATSHADARIELVQPVDVYSQVNRAVKYGFLFIGFTFTAFLLFDLVGGRRVSAVEYLLVGAGLVLFFVMLLAFAEVIGFAAAYALAAFAIGALLTAYSAAVLGSWRRAGAIGTLIGVLYGTLYVLLSLEEYSLLIGSLLLFAALAAVMYLTRNLEWGGRPETTAQEGLQGI